MEKLILEELYKIKDHITNVGTDVASIKTHQKDMDKTLTEVKEQTTKTNGRVTVLEARWAKVTGVAIGASGLFSLGLKLML